MDQPQTVEFGNKAKQTIEMSVGYKRSLIKCHP